MCLEIFVLSTENIVACTVITDGYNQNKYGLNIFFVQMYEEKKHEAIHKMQPGE